MVAKLIGLPSLCVLLGLFTSTAAQTVEILNPGQVTYVDSNVYGVLGKAVILDCGGNTLPDVYFWSFTKPGTNAAKAVVYDLGKGPRVQALAQTLGDLRIISQSASISIENLPLAAHGLYTCQAIYDRPPEAAVYYYYVYLTVRVPVSKPYVQMGDASPVEGTSVWLRCALENGSDPVLYVWEHETRNSVVTVFAQGNNSRINVTDVNRNHTGWYRCVASNPVNSERSDRIWLDIIFGPDQPQIDVTPYSVAERGYSALERETVSLLCQAQSNPPSQYMWLYNNSQVYAGQQFTITKILRMHTGNYACLAQNTYLNTRSIKTISLTVYYPPDGSPSCLVEAAVNHTSFKLLCSWPGGVPSPSLSWTRGLLALGQETIELSNNTTLPQSVALKSNYTLFTCTGSHPALLDTKHCSIRTYSPPARPKCLANVTRYNQYLTLSCFWNGGVPRALLWWEGPGGQSQAGEENSNFWEIPYGTGQSGLYTCHAKHPLLAQNKSCSLMLEAPVLVIQRRNVSVYEGSDVQLTCNVRANYPPADEVTWFNNQRKVVGDDPNKYLLQQAATWANLTVRQADVSQDSGQYWCAASNAVGGAEISVTLLVMRYSMPPNVTLVKVMYSSRQRSDVELEWKTEEDEALSGFILEHRWKQGSTGSSVWLQTVIQDPLARIHRLASLTPTFTYQIRITAVNHRTTGHPSVVITPDPPDGSPSCLVEAAVNHTSFKLLCSWPGGVPSPSLSWTRGLLALGQQTIELSNNATLPQSVALKSNYTLFTCTGSHPALKESPYCSIRTYSPPAEPSCSAYATGNNHHLMLSCFWNGGVPRALLWWEGPGGQSQAGEENSNILVLRYGTAQSGQSYTCHAKHPLLAQSKTCSLTLEAPVLVTQRRVVSVYEGSDVQLTCNMRANYPPADEVTWFNNQRKVVGDDPNKYLLQQATTWANLTVRQADVSQDSGQYWCAASNAVGGAEISVTLLVMRYPMPPNVTLVKVMYIRQRSEVELEWKTEEDEALSGFILEHRWLAEQQAARSSNVSEEPPVWLQTVIQDPLARSHRLASLTPTFTYQIRITAVNHRTTGHPSVVYSPDPPDGSPSCLVEAAVNHTSFKLLCSWPGGVPSPSLSWTRGLLALGQQTIELSNNATLPQSVALKSNYTLFTCTGSHPALLDTKHCSIRTYTPPSDPECSAYATRYNQYLMLSCFWNGGVPRALLWWEGPGGQSQAGEENSNILVLRYGTAQSGQPYTCRAKHPLLAQSKTCSLTLEAPVLVIQRRFVSVYEGSDVQLTCNVRANFLPADEVTWFNNQTKDVWNDPNKYLLQRSAAWANLTVRETDGTQDSGQYWCTASNAVGGAEIPVTLLVMRHPMPPNATLVKVAYSSRQRSEVELEWKMEGDGGSAGEPVQALTGFVLEHARVAARPRSNSSSSSSSRSSSSSSSYASGKTQESTESTVWLQSVILNPATRSHRLASLTPTFTYQIRIRAVNHRTLGHPSAVKTPADPPFNSYPAVIGAAIGGMLFAAIITVLLLIYIIRNRNNNPRIHDLLFGRQNSQSRENINFPEDEVVAGAEEPEVQASSSPAPAMALPRAASPLSATPTPGQAPPPGDDNEPVNVTITVQAVGS